MGDGMSAEREREEEVLRLRSLHVEAEVGKPWRARAGFDGEAAEMFAASLCDFYRKSGGENYVEMHMRDPANPTEEFVVTVQRKAGKTPHELRKEAEAKLEALRAPREEPGRPADNRQACGCLIGLRDGVVRLLEVCDLDRTADEAHLPSPVEEPGRRDGERLDWLARQTQPHHGVILCALDLPEEKWASVQRVNQFHNPHKVEWCHEAPTLREAIDCAITLENRAND